MLMSFIKTTSSVIAMIVTTTGPDIPKQEQPRTIFIDLPPSETSTYVKGPATVDLSYLGNASVGGLNSTYLGVSGKLPDSKVIDFNSNLKKMWDRKLKFRNVTGATRSFADTALDRYEYNPGITNIGQFIQDADSETRIGYDGINFHKLCGNFKLSKSQCITVRKTSKRIRGKHLAAYGMTELFPSHNGKFNYVMLDTLLRNAGQEYIFNIPALGDKYLSLGFYQFTSFAVRHDNERVEGASVISKFSSEKLPGSVSMLRQEQHHLAAYYFAVYNVIRLVRATKSHKQLRSCDIGEVTEFVATAHHNPRQAIRNGSRWVQGGCKVRYIQHLGPKLTTYAKKTANNLDAVEAYQ